MEVIELCNNMVGGVSELLSPFLQKFAIIANVVLWIGVFVGAPLAIAIS